MPEVVWLLPGTLCRRALFAGVVRRLRPSVVVRTLDWPTVRRLLAQADGPPLNLAGFSLGGIAALGLLQRAPERVGRLALIASNAEGASDATRQRVRRQTRLLASAGTAGVLAAALPSYFCPPARPAWRLALAQMAHRTRRGDARAQLSLAASRPGSHAALARFAGPLAVVAGARDALCTPALQARLLQAQPAAAFTLVPRCGHVLPLQAPAALARALRAWLRSPLEPSA